MKRPMLYWVILFILGELCYKIVPVTVVGIILIGMTGIGVFLKNTYLKENRVLVLIGILFFLFGVFCMYRWERALQYQNIPEGEPISFQGKVTDYEISEWGIQYSVRLDEINDKHVFLSVQMQLEEILSIGTKIEATGNVKYFTNATNPGEFDEATYQMGQGILFELEDVELHWKQTPEISVRDVLKRVQIFFSERYLALFDEKESGLASAMVLGDKSNLDVDVKQLYQRNGIAHLIAISGLHIAMIGGVFYKLIRKLTGSYGVAAGVGVVFVIFYGMMTGLSSATVRAVIMLVTSIGADVCGRRYDSLSAIAFSLLLMLISNPYQLMQVGFLLSFGAVVGIAVVQPAWKELFPKMPRCMDGLMVSLSVQLVLLPVMLYYFYEIPVYGILLNVVVVPLMSVLLAILLGVLIISVVSMDIAAVVAHVAGIIFKFYEMLCRLSECIPGHTICTGRPAVSWIVMYYIVLAGFVWFAYHKEWKKNCITCVGMGMLCLACWMPAPLMVCMFDVGQGDGIYIRTTHRQHILVDGGSSSKQNVGKYILKNGVKYYGGSQLDYVVVSHSDSDHYSGIMELLEEETIDIKNIVLPAITNPDEGYLQIEDAARANGCSILYLKRGDELQIDGITMRCLNPEPAAYEDKNTGSIVLQMTYKEFDMLLTGDMDKEVEKQVVSDLQGCIEVLKVAHHGSATASSEAFLEYLKVSVACVSVGERNRYGHPAKEVMERLYAFAQNIYLTKDCGAITIETDGFEYSVTSYRRNGDR